MSEANYTYNQIAEMFEYDPEQKRIVDSLTGDPVGQVNRGEYVIRLPGGEFRAQRIMYMLLNGHWPKGRMIALDGDKFNLTPENFHVPEPATKRTGVLLVNGEWIVFNRGQQIEKFMTFRRAARFFGKLLKETGD